MYDKPERLIETAYHTAPDHTSPPKQIYPSLKCPLMVAILYLFRRDVLAPVTPSCEVINGAREFEAARAGGS